MAAKGRGMAAPIEQGHYDSSKAPRLAKGDFQQVGTFIDEGEMTTVMPRGTSVNVKTNMLQNGEKN